MFSLQITVLLSLCAFVFSKKDVIILTEDDWSDMLTGEWLVKFYAPWCPACRNLEEPWEGVATWQDDLKIKVAEIDVTENPSLSGRFLVTALPTIYHVKDGEFRVYTDQRSEDEIVAFVDEKKWENVQPVTWYMNPSSVHMGIVGAFFKLSLSIRDVHNRMTSEFGIPTWGSYVIFAVITIVFGLILGLCCVCVCDCCCPQPPPPRRPAEPLRYTRAPGMGHTKNSDDDSDIIHDDRTEPSPGGASGSEARPKTARKRVVKKE